MNDFLFKNVQIEIKRWNRWKHLNFFQNFFENEKSMSFENFHSVRLTTVIVIFRFGKIFLDPLIDLMLMLTETRKIKSFLHSSCFDLLNTILSFAWTLKFVRTKSLMNIDGIRLKRSFPKKFRIVSDESKRWKTRWEIEIGTVLLSDSK